MRYVSSIEEITLEEVALKMLKKGMSIEDITSVTGLSIEQIQKLQFRHK